MELQTWRMMVACHDSGGMPDLYFCKVRCSNEQYNDGEHYALASRKAEENCYEGPFVSFCEDDAAGKAMLDLFEWETASIFTV